MTLFYHYFPELVNMNTQGSLSNLLQDGYIATSFSDNLWVGRLPRWNNNCNEPFLLLQLRLSFSMIGLEPWILTNCFALLQFWSVLKPVIYLCFGSDWGSWNRAPYFVSIRLLLCHGRVVYLFQNLLLWFLSLTLDFRLLDLGFHVEHLL